MAVYCKVTIDPNIRELIQARSYEPIICALMNESSKIFPNKYRHEINQANGECDFTDLTTEQKYDAKLLFSNEQCQSLSKGKEGLIDWLSSVRREMNEASNAMLDKNIEAIRSTSLYKEMLSRLQSVANDEEAVLFIPFPIVPIQQDSIFMQFAGDIVCTTYDIIVSDYHEQFSKKKTYIIFPSVKDEKMILYDLTCRRKEFFPINYIESFISYTLKDYPGEDADILIFR